MPQTAQYARNTPSVKSDLREEQKKPGLVQRMRAVLARRPDSEHEISYNRFAICAVIIAYLIGASLFGDAGAHDTLKQLAVSFGVFNACAFTIFAWILYQPGVSPTRRLLSVAVDVGFLSFLMHVGDRSAAAFYPIYLWAIFGNGFRFGLRYLFGAAAISITTFAIVVLTTPFWQENRSLSLGLIVGQMVLPAYAALLIKKLSEAKYQAEEASRAKSLFLASVTHELRTPLNAIIGFSDILTDLAKDEEQIDMSRTIGMAGRSLLHLINSIIDLSQHDATRSQTRLEDIDLFALFASTRDMLAVQAHTRGLWLTLHITSRTPQFVMSDQRTLEEILVNLCGNALKFTTKGHVGIFLDAIESDAEKVKLRIEVEDTGIGIKPEAQKKIFESFTQADETIIDRFGGSGLGLTIVKQLVEARGGQIGVTSEVGAGSTFWLELECPRSEAQPPELPMPPTPWLLLSEDGEVRTYLQELGAPVERVGLSADLVKRISDLKRDRPHHRPVVILDQWSLGRDLERFARDLRGKDPMHAPALVALKENSSLEIEARDLYLTVLPRPLDDASVKSMWMQVTWSERKKLEHIAESKAKMGPAGLTPLSILVAEDNKTNQKVIAKILERAGHQVHLVDNGEIALETLIETPFDLALIDINMPVLNGIEMTKLYRFVTVDRPRLPIIALTADATAEARIRCFEAGMDDCLTKPVEPDVLLQMLNTFASVLPAKEKTTVLALRSNTLAAKANAQPESPIDAPVPGDEDTAIDSDTLTYLQKLGGKDFVSDLLDQYVSDAARMLRELSDAVEEENLPKFHDRIHALRSCSANVGAKAIYNLCLSWREIDAYDLAVKGEEHMKALEAEFTKAQSALSTYEHQ